MYATGGTSTDVIADDVLVLATSASSAEGSSDAEVAWITIAVEAESVQEIVAAAQRAELYFALPSEASGQSGAEGDAPGEGRGDL